jgi:predicted acylesterase/phospholipase RssA
VAYAPNLTGVAQLAAVWEQLQTDHVFPGGRLHRAWNVVRRGTHLFGNDGLAALIHHSTPARSFSDLEIPFRVIATDLDTGEEVVLARGPLKPALLVNNVPLWHALSGPVDRVFVLNVSSGAGDHAVRSPLDVVMTSFMHARNQRYELERRQAIEHVDIIDLPRPRDTRELFDFSGAHALIESAYELAQVKLDEYERECEAAREAAAATAAADEALVHEQRRRFRLRRGA